MSQATYYYLRLQGLGAEDPEQFQPIRRCLRQRHLRPQKRFWDALDVGPLWRRKGLVKMIVGLRNGESSTVVVEKAERLAEDPYVRNRLLAYLQILGVTVIEAAIDPPNGLEIADAHLEEGGNREALKAANQELAALKRRATEFRNNHRRGRIPFGTVSNEGDVLRLMRRLRRLPKKGRRMSYAAIAEELNSRRIPARDGGEWRAWTVARILKRKSR